MIDPDGMEAEDEEDDDGPGPNDPPPLSSGVRMTLVKLEHPIDALAVGPPTRGFNDISSTSERFATSGESDDPKSLSILSGGDGNQSNAFRHGIW